MSAVVPPDWSRPRRSGRRHAVWVFTLGVVMIISASVVVSLVLWREPAPGADSRLAGGSGGQRDEADPNATAPVGRLDSATRLARIGPASLVLPDDPYVLCLDPRAVEGTLDLFFWATASVHPDYDGTRDWSAAVLLGRVTPALASGDLAEQAELTLDRLSTAFYGRHSTTVDEVRWTDHAVEGHPGLVATARVAYTIPGLPSRFDQIRAKLVRLDDGSMIIAASAVPDDADPEVHRSAAESLRTLRVS